MVETKVAIVGTGLASYGVCSTLLGSHSIDITIFDPSVERDSPLLTNIQPPNSIPVDDSYYPYGLNDTLLPFSHSSQRICSSHSFGGFTEVYSGAVSLPTKTDLRMWPAESTSFPLANILMRGHLSLTEPVNPPDFASKTVDYSHISLSRFLVSFHQKDKHKILPFRARQYFSSISSQSAIHLRQNIYVTRVVSRAQGISIYGVYRSSNRSKEEIYMGTYNAVFLCAGCVNTTLIVHNSLPVKPSFYPIKSCPLMILPALSFKRWADQKTRARADSELPVLFHEFSSTTLRGTNVHTQLGFLKHQMNSPFLIAAGKLINRTLFPHFSFMYLLSIFHSSLHSDSSIVSTASKTSISEVRQRLSFRIWLHTYLKLFRDFMPNLIFPLPFPPFVIRFITGNSLGGWHFGSTIPLCSSEPSSSPTCNVHGEVSSLPGVYIADSASFPDVPGSTIAFLTVAHASRIASSWLRLKAPSSLGPQNGN